MAEQGLRFNEGKNRYDLLDPFAVDNLTKVFTFGASKYADHNWLKGLKWSNITSSLKRHLAAYEQGEDYDKESGLLHAAHIAWNAMALLSHYKYHPQLDDRLQPYMFTKRIGIDIDECIADFTGAYSEKTGKPAKPIHWSYCDEMLDNFGKWTSDKTIDGFYLNVQPLLKSEELGFEPICYITSRPVPTEITRQWIIKHGFPQKPIFTTSSSNEKVAVAREQGLDYFIDDNYETFIKMNKAGICCFLMDAPHNQKYNVGYKRIKDFNDFKQRFL